jgi:polar amino acid transport system permease protein
MTTGTSTVTTEPELIKAVPLRHYGRWAAATIVIILVGLFIYGAATNDAYDWSTYWKYLFDRRISQAAVVTLELTVLSMILGIILGVTLAVMRLSPNPVLKSAAWVYLWIFRGTPVYVQLVFWGLFTSIYQHVHLGIPFAVQFATFNIQSLDAPFTFAVIGLGLNEAAYMAEIVRAGITSVGEGQTEASVALGMTWVQTMRRTVLPQAMRVIIPPTGNEVISMLKTTSLVVAVPLTTDLYAKTRDISGVIFRPIPLLLVAATWYLFFTSILMIGQYYLEKYFARGSTRKLTRRQLAALADAQAESMESQEKR